MLCVYVYANSAIWGAPNVLLNVRNRHSYGEQEKKEIPIPLCCERSYFTGPQCPLRKAENVGDVTYRDQSGRNQK